MRRSAAPSVIAKKRQEQGKENVAELKSNVCDKAGGNEARRKVSIGRRKFKSPVASVGLVDPSALKPRSEDELGRCGSEGFVQRNDSIVMNDAPLVGRNPSQVLQLINSGRAGAEGNKTTPADDSFVSLSPESANSLLPSRFDSVPDFVGKGESEAQLPSVANLKFNSGCSSFSESSSTLGVKRSCAEDDGLENENLDITRKKRHSAVKQRESLLDGKIVCVEEVAAISKETIVTGEPENKHLNVSHIPLSGTDRDDLNVTLECTSSEVKGEQHFHVKKEHDNGTVSLDSNPTKPGTVLQGPQRQRPSLHEMNSKVASKTCQEVVSAEHYSVMYCPRKPNTKRKGPWSDGIIVCQGRSCTLQDLDGTAVTKAIVQGLKDMPEGATLEVGKFEVEVMRKASSEVVHCI